MITRYLLRRVLDPTAAERRRCNYRVLLDLLRDYVPTSFARLPAGASPFAFPLRVHDRLSVAARLEKQGVHCLSLWLHPHPTLPVERFAGAHTLRETVVALPVHQELSLADLERIALSVRNSILGVWR
jgi:dTDP-4-amino-4,6-dideoxygalactose transaminase